MFALCEKREYFGGFGEREELDVPVFFSPSQLLFSFFSLVTADVVGAAVQNSFSVCVLHTHTRCNIPLLRAL